MPFYHRHGPIDFVSIVYRRLAETVYFFSTLFSISRRFASLHRAEFVSFQIFVLVSVEKRKIIIMKAKGNLREYRIIGRKLPSATVKTPPLYEMHIYAPDEVQAKSRFWFFLRQLKRVKKSAGEIVECKLVNERKPLTVKNFGIWLRYDSRSGHSQHVSRIPRLDSSVGRDAMLSRHGRQTSCSALDHPNHEDQTLSGERLSTSPRDTISRLDDQVRLQIHRGEFRYFLSLRLDSRWLTKRPNVSIIRALQLVVLTPTSKHAQYVTKKMSTVDFLFRIEFGLG